MTSYVQVFMTSETALENKVKKKLWHFPWGYRESFLVAFEILLFGMIIEVINRGHGISKLVFPVNIFIGLALIAAVLITGTQFKRQAVVRWLSSVPAAVSSISLFAFLVLLQGFIPQNQSSKPDILTLLGLDHVKNSWVFAISGIYLLTALGLVIIRKSIPFRKINLPFLLNHLGLWIAVAAGSLGSGDLLSLSIYLQEGDPLTCFAYDRENNAHTLPFSIKLTSFDINYFPPDLVLLNAETGTIINGDKQPLTEVEVGKEFWYKDWQIRIEDFLEAVYYMEGNYYEKDTLGSAPAARVSAINKNTGENIAGWVSCGSDQMAHSFLTLGNDCIVAMTIPEPQKYSSQVIIKKIDGDTDTTRIEVNKPCRLKSWRLYQMSYDEKKGKWSEYSIIEAVKDPWLPLVYFGIFLMMGGAVYLFWTGRNMNNK